MSYTYFPMNGSLITMTHVCRSWRNTLLSTPDLWTQIDFSVSTNPEQVECFLRRSKKLPLDIHHYLEDLDRVEPFISTTIHNLPRLGRLDIDSCLPRLGRLLEYFSAPTPELEHLKITNDPNITDKDMKLPNTIFGGRLPKLTVLELGYLRTDLRSFNFPSLTWFSFMTGTKISIQDLMSFFERCPLLEFIQICLEYTAQQPIPPRERVRLGALKGLRFDQTACTSGLLDHLVLPNCTEVMLKGHFTGADLDHYGDPAARIHPSSIDHLPVMRGITKAVAMPCSCILSGPNGTLRFWCPENRENFNAEFFTFSPITLSGIRELWVGATELFSDCTTWKQTAAGAHGAFEVLTKVEDLTVFNCDIEPIFATLGTRIGDVVLLPGLRRLTIYVGRGGLGISALIQCAKARKEHSRPLGEVTITFENEPGVDVIQGVESLREFVEGLTHRVGVSPVSEWEGEDCGIW